MGDEGLDPRLAQWGALAGGLAHEIKNPLSTMNITLQLLREDLAGQGTVKNAQVRPRVELLLGEVERLQRILNSFLRLAREPELELRERDPNRLLQDLVTFLAPEFEENGIDVVTQYESDPPPIHVDPDLLRQALFNLLRNAIQAMPEGGTLTLQTRRGDGVIEFVLIDTGEGIPEELLQRIFDGFFSTKPEGSGIGLSVSRQIVQLHGGRIEVASAPGHGSRFVVSLPIGGPPTGAGPEESGAS